MPDKTPGHNTYFHLLPGFSYRNSYHKGRRINVRYFSDVNMPTASQLLPVTNTINPLFLYKGNMELEPEYTHSLYISWSIFDQFSFTSLFTRLGSSYTLNKIGASRIINPDYTQLVTPVNVPYYYNLYGYAYFSTPIRSLGIKVNVRSHEMWSKSISMINNEDNINTNLTNSVKLSVENRNKKKWNLLAGGSVSLTNSQFSIAESMDNVYYNTSYFSVISFTPTDKWNFDFEGSVANYNSRSFTESISIPVLNAGISYYFMEGEIAMLALQGNDLLNKSSSIYQKTENNFLVREESNRIGQRILLVLRIKIGKK